MSTKLKICLRKMQKNPKIWLEMSLISMDSVSNTTVPNNLIDLIDREKLTDCFKI